MWKAIALMSMGLCGFFVTDAFVSSAFLDDAPENVVPNKPSNRRTAALYGKYIRNPHHNLICRGDCERLVVVTGRCVVALMGSMVHNSGIWIILDEKLYASKWRDCSWSGATYDEAWPCWARNVSFIVCGYLVMLITRSAAGNAGVSQSMDLTPTPVLHVDTARTKLGQRHQNATAAAIVAAALNGKAGSEAVVAVVGSDDSWRQQVAEAQQAERAAPEGSVEVAAAATQGGDSLTSALLAGPE